MEGTVTMSIKEYKQTLAEQQLIGFGHARREFAVKEFIALMGLTPVEWERIKNNGFLEEYRPLFSNEEIEEIEQYVNRKNLQS